jgi:hypothetical protein
MTHSRVWVVVNKKGLITGASVDRGLASDVNFLMPMKNGSRLLKVDGPVTMSTHISEYRLAALETSELDR